MQSLKSLWQHIVPFQWRQLIYDVREHFRITEIENGHWLSVRWRASVDKQGNPIPWLSYPALEYINQLDFSNKDVFEYGAGNSTLFWRAIARKIVSVEDDPQFYQALSERLKMIANVELHLCVDKADYANKIKDYEPFDVIVIDGSHRLDCARVALQHLKPTGMIIVDNTEIYSEVATLLRSSELIQIDMIGFAPIVPKIQATSFFLQRDFSFVPRAEKQPTMLIGKREAS